MCVVGLAPAFISTADAVVTPDTVSPADIVDNANNRPYIVGLGIRSESGATGASCTGLLINPRTVLFASHCVFNLPPSAYDTPIGPGNRAQVGYTTDPLFGRTNLRNWLFQFRAADGVGAAVPPGDGRTMVDSVNVWWDPRANGGPLHDPNAGSFLPADIAIAAFDEPNEILGRDAEDGIGLLFSPVKRLIPVTIGGYGQAGNGMTSARILAPDEATFYRRVARNMLGFLGSDKDLYDGAEPPDIAEIFNPAGLNYQDMYWLDFDDPLNRPFDVSISANYGGPTDAGGPVNPGATTTLDFNVIKDEAVAGEAITAAGDSGSALITSAYGREVSLGVLSQGSRFFHDVVGFPDDNFVHFTDFSNFGTAAGYNPLFLFWDQIVVNNPYKYVQARSGNREWTNPQTWVQEVDPLYYTLDSRERLKNELPNQPALGSSDDTRNFGTINDNPAPIAACAFPGTCPPTGGGSEPLPDHVTGGPSVALTGGGGGNGQGPSSADWDDGVLIPVMGGALTGPGTTNFVPNNTNGTPGIQNSARFFEVNLRNSGTLTLRGATITIDRLNIRDINAELDIKAGARLNTVMSSYMDIGRLNVDGVFAARAFDIATGVLSGKGRVITPDGVANSAGIVSPGGFDAATLTIEGDYAQGGWATVFFQIERSSVDLLEVDGHADIDGNLLVSSSRTLRFGDRFTVVHADSVSGDFDHVFGSGTLLFGDTVADADSIDLVINAHSLSSIFDIGHNLWSLAKAIDFARDRHYLDMQGVFDRIDTVPINSLEAVLPTLTPISAFGELSMAINYSQGFVRDLAARSDELRAGVHGISQRSVLNGYRILQTPDARGSDEGTGIAREDARPIDMGDRFGLFVSGQGNLSDVGAEAYRGDRYDPMSLRSDSSANMTIGLDYRVNDHFALGVASTLSHYLARSEQLTPLDHQGYGAMVYGAAWDGPWSLDSYVGVAHQDYDMSRLATPGLGMLTADASPGAMQTLAGVRAGWTMHPVEGLAIGPRVSVNYSRVSLDSYREMGAGSFDLMVDSRAIDSLQVETAMEFSYQPTRFGEPGRFAMFGRVGMVNELGDGADTVMARFAAAPEMAFAIERGLDRQWFSAGTGLSYRFDPATSLSLEASSDVGRDDFANTSAMVSFHRTF